MKDKSVADSYMNDAKKTLLCLIGELNKPVSEQLQDDMFEFAIELENSLAAISDVLDSNIEASDYDDTDEFVRLFEKAIALEKYNLDVIAEWLVNLHPESSLGRIGVEVMLNDSYDVVEAALRNVLIAKGMYPQQWMIRDMKND